MGLVIDSRVQVALQFSVSVVHSDRSMQDDASPFQDVASAALVVERIPVTCTARSAWAGAPEAHTWFRVLFRERRAPAADLCMSKIQVHGRTLTHFLAASV